MTQEDTLARYRHLRAIAMSHNSAALGFVSRQAVLENAKRLGLPEGRMLVAGSKVEMALVFGLAPHAAKEARSRALDRYARATPLPPGSARGPHARRPAPRPLLGLVRRAPARDGRVGGPRRDARGRGVAG